MGDTGEANDALNSCATASISPSRANLGRFKLIFLEEFSFFAGGNNLLSQWLYEILKKIFIYQ